MKPGTYGRHISTESSGMDDLVVANGVPAMHAEVSPGEAGSPRGFSRNNPRDKIEGTPSKTRRRT